MHSEIYLTYTQLSSSEMAKEFIKSCSLGDVKVIKYLLTSLELDECVRIDENENSGIIAACMNGRIEAVKFLLTSKDIPENSYIHAKNDVAFKFACMNEQYEILDYLINEYCITKTQIISDYLIDYPNKIISGMFLNRDLELRLSISMVNKKNILKI